MSFFKKNYLQAGLALFAMFFGAGNLIFPLALGRDALNQTPYALLGFFITAVCIPFFGVFVMACFKGNIGEFFSKLGGNRGLLFAGLIITLLGPLGAAPRCLTIAYAVCFQSNHFFSLVLFAFFTCFTIYSLAIREKGILKPLGALFAPIKLALLFLIIIKGFWSRPDEFLIQTQKLPMTSFFEGLKNGYFTMDLMAALFFAPLILSQLTVRNSTMIIKKASVVAGILLAIVYTGFSFLSFFYAKSLEGITPDQILVVLSYKILGSYGALFLTLAVGFACFSTALALIAAFVNFIYIEAFKKKVSKKWILGFCCTLTFLMTCLSFQGINRFLSPFLDYFYPVLIVLTFYNFFAKKRPFQGEVL